MLHVLQRLEETIAEEQKSLEAQDLTRLSEFSQRKARCLLELTRYMRLKPVRPIDGLGHRLADVRAQLDRNKQLLSIHANAARSIAALLEDALQAADSDGTYSRISCRREGGR